MGVIFIDSNGSAEEQSDAGDRELYRGCLRAEDLSDPEAALEDDTDAVGSVVAQDDDGQVSLCG